MTTDPLFATVQRALAGQYSLEREIGRGGMGVVFLAREVELARLVALKVLPPDLAAEPETRRRFLREARTAAGLSHPHIVPIHRVAEAGDIVYFTMMYVDGETLGERLRTRGPLSPSAAARMLREVSQALAYAHGRGIVHRDIKPDNILLERDSGRALVTDFGIAGEAHAASGEHGPVMGTIHFMSPEQAAGLPLDGRSDLYSLGVVAHVSISGRLPAPSGASSAGGSEPATDSSLALASPTTPRALVAAIDRALAPDPEARFATAEAFAAAVDAATVPRRALPAPVRAWLAARDPWRVPYAIWSGGWLLSALLDRHDPEFVLFALVASLVPTIPTTVFELRTTRRLLDSGYSLDDARAALPEWQAEEREERLAVATNRPAWLTTVGRTVAWSSSGTLLLFAITDLPSFMGTMEVFLLIVTAAASPPLLTAMGVSLFPSLDRPGRVTLRQRLWNSALGQRMERLLASGRRTLAPANAFRPTERALGSAITSLWESLPTAYRKRLPEVPEVVEQLELHAYLARYTIAKLEDGEQALGWTGVAAGRESARKELASAVAALESIRLDLLRLIGGDLDLAPTATVMIAAREVAAELKRIREAEAEVERVVRPPLGLDLRPHTPT